MTISAIGQRGKKAEKIVETLLKKLNCGAGFSFFRMPDTRSARNFLAASPADFIYFSTAMSGFLEVKSTTHSYRIAKDKISQLAVLKKFEMAGARSLILIHHSTEDVWRVVTPGALESDVPSWDLREVTTHPSAEAALRSTGAF